MCHSVITKYIKAVFDSLDGGDLRYKIVKN